MCGAMVWCCLRSGRLGRSHSQSFQTRRCYEASTQDTTSPLPLDAQEPSTNSWLTAGMPNNNINSGGSTLLLYAHDHNNNMSLYVISCRKLDPLKFCPIPGPPYYSAIIIDDCMSIISILSGTQSTTSGLRSHASFTTWVPLKNSCFSGSRRLTWCPRERRNLGHLSLKQSHSTKTYRMPTPANNNTIDYDNTLSCDVCISAFWLVL